MVRATEIVIIAKVQNQASAQLRRLAKDVGGLGRAQKLAQAAGRTDLRVMQQRNRMMRAGELFALRQQAHTRQFASLERQLTEQTNRRFKLQNRMAQTGMGSARMRALQREMVISEMRSNELIMRRNELTRIGSNEQALYNRQLKIMEVQLAHIREEQAAIAMEQKLASSFAARAQNVSRVASHVGRAATFGGLLGTAGFAAASKQFADFSTLSTKAATQIADNADKGVGAVIASGKRLEQAVLNQMQRFPASQNEMADALYQIYSSMDIGEKQGVKLLQRVNQLSVAMGSDLPTATNVAITALNNFGGEGRGVLGTFDDMAAIIRLGRMELTDFDSMMNSIAPAARGAGFSLRDMGGAMALITRQIPSQERGATALARLIDVFNNRDFQAGMRRAGKDIVDSNGHLIDFIDIIGKIESMHPSGVGLQNFIQNMTAFGRGKGMGREFTVQARRALVPLIKSYQQLRGLQTDVNNSTGEFQQRLQAMMQSPGVQWAIFVNQMRALAIEIGRDAIPAIQSLMGWIKGLVDRWRELSPETRRLIIQIGALASVFMLIGGPILTVLGAIGSLITTFVILTKVLGAGSAAGGAGLLGRMGIFLALLGEIAAIAAVGIVVTITLKWVTSKMPGWAQKIFNYSGKDALHDLGRGLGLFEQNDGIGINAGGAVRKNQPFFNPNARLPGMNTKASRRMIQEINQAKDPLNKYAQLMANSRKETVKAFKASEIYKEVQRLVGGQLDGTAAAQKKYTEDMKQYNEQLKQWTQQRADVIRNAHEEYQSIVDRAVDNMISKYNELRDANASAFGTMFQGPLLTGESFQEAQDWGISPTIGIINKDLSQQIGAFNKWKGDLRALAKRGAPKQLVQELTDLGPDAADKIEVLRKASPKMFNRFIALWKQKNKAIERETKRDFNNQLKIWESHGKNMGLKIIAGLESEGGALERTMRNILRNSFNGDLMNEIVNKALAEFIRNNPAPKHPTRERSGPPPPLKEPATTTTTAPKRIPISKMNLQQVTRALRRDVPKLRGTDAALKKLAWWATQPGSRGGTDITDAETADLTTLSNQRRALARRVQRERRRRRRLMRRSNKAASAATQDPNNNLSGYQPMPTKQQYIKVELHSKDEPTVVQARRAAFIIANQARRV